MPMQRDFPEPKPNPCAGCPVFERGDCGKDPKCDTCLKRPDRPPFRKVIIDVPRSTVI